MFGADLNRITMLKASVFNQIIHPQWKRQSDDGQIITQTSKALLMQTLNWHFLKLLMTTLEKKKQNEIFCYQ